VGQLSGVCNLRWRELFSSEELRNWVNDRRVPKRVRAELGYPGVYRFVFAEVRDENGAHTPCYIGEAGNIGAHLVSHFRQERQSAVEPTTKRFRTGWFVRGAIRISDNHFKLEVLTIEGPVNFCGLIFGSDTIPSPFENSFLRKMVENRAIIAAEHIDNSYPLNRRGTLHVLRDLQKMARSSSAKTSKVIQTRRPRGSRTRRGRNP
jgi:hypothetical protein